MIGWVEPLRIWEGKRVCLACFTRLSTQTNWIDAVRIHRFEPMFWIKVAGILAIFAAAIALVCYRIWG